MQVKKLDKTDKYITCIECYIYNKKRYYKKNLMIKNEKTNMSYNNFLIVNDS